VPSKPGEFLGHPKGLFILFFTEMWERFSYYGMRALLVLYMVDFFKWSQQDASKIYKWYTSLVYLTPLLGGYMADRVLGNKSAIIIGAVLMSIGHFLMASENIGIFYMALGFLTLGNGFFKPNMSVQVGRLYPQNDPRRDGAYTIFYMGINLGAFLSPLVCGTLRDTPGLGYHWGFGAAGVGMVLGLLFYLFGLPWIKELPADAVYHDPDAKPEDEAEGGKDHAMTEEEAERTPSITPRFASVSPAVFVMIGVVVALGAPLLGWQGLISWDNVVSLLIAAGCSVFAAWILSNLSMAVRDRVLAIYVLSVFVVFFWGAFEQAGNAMNVWADQTTNRFITDTPAEPSIYPAEAVDAADQGFYQTFKDAIGRLTAINPVLTTSFQSINALAIVVFAPIFAWLWLFLARKHVNVSIATKMSIGVFLQGVAFALMIWAATYENGASDTTLAALPDGTFTENGSQIFFNDPPDFSTDDGDTALQGFLDGEKSEPMIAHGGRLLFDKDSGQLAMTGVLNANHRDRIFRSTVASEYVADIWAMAAQSVEEKKKADEAEAESFSFEYKLAGLPDGFDAQYLNGYKREDLSFDPATNTFTVGMLIADKDYKQILVSGSDPTLRTALNDLYVKSSKFKVSSWWLFWFYILCTLGELCLSPVGLSMVSKLAPRRFATMLMGMWLLTSFFGNFTAGLAGEHWEMMEPTTYFSYVTIVMVCASFVCFLLVKKITSMMHGVK
jgi:POT family proton-dependent oligopeptide transporter